MIVGLTIDRAAPDERGLLEALTQLYLHDFSELYADTALLDLNDAGLFVPEPGLDRWWSAEGHVPLLFRWHGRPAGFALVNSCSEIGLPVDRAIAEFFVVRKYRRRGLGLAAANAVISSSPGTWEAAVMRANGGAARFWDRAIRGCPGVTDVTVHDVDDARWNGTVFRFEMSLS